MLRKIPVDPRHWYEDPADTRQETPMNDAIKVLDHGYVRLVEAWGHGDAGTARADDVLGIGVDYECGIIEAARQSTQASFRGWEDRKCSGCNGGRQFLDHESIPCPECNGKGYTHGDKRLLAFLHNNRHATPFEFSGMTLEVQDPTCVVWEWVRHRTVSLSDDTFPGDTGFNVMSSRYGEIPHQDYLPTVERVTQADPKNKQAGRAKGAPECDEETAANWIKELGHLYSYSQKVYKLGLECGVPKEVARLALTFGRYWRMRVTANLRNWLAFVTLRSDPAAQWEIRQYSDVVGQVIARMFPRTWEVFQAGRAKPV